MKDDLFSVEQKVVIVTGASRGIGRAVAEGFFDHGAKVAFVARSAEMVERVAGLPSDRALAIQCDVGQHAAAEDIRDKVVARFSGIDVLVNNAGISRGGDDPYDEQIWDETLKVNLTSVVRLSRAVADVMKQHAGGSIINIASIGAILGFPNNPSYQAAKGGLRQLTRAMGRDWAPHNIRVNNICPGYIVTGMTRKSFDDEELREDRTSRTMLGRWGNPEELVGPCIFLASAASSYVTGGDLLVDGGWTAKGL